MGNTKSNPLKYFNDQAESRSKNMHKALKRFQTNAIVNPTPQAVNTTPQAVNTTPKEGPRLGTSLEADTRVGVITGSASTGVNAEAGKKVFTDPNLAFNIQGNQGNKFSISGNPFDPKNTLEVGASKTFNVGKTDQGNPKLKIRVSGSYSPKSGFSGNATPSRNTVKDISGANPNQSQSYGTNYQKKGGSTSKKKK